MFLSRSSSSSSSSIISNNGMRLIYAITRIVIKYNHCNGVRIRDGSGSKTLHRLISTSAPRYGILHHEWIVAGKVEKNNRLEHTTNNGGVVLFLHGLLGNGKNLRTPAKKLTERFPSISALLLDLRGHGITSIQQQQQESSSCEEEDGDESLLLFHPPHTMDACAQDIVDTVQSLNLVGPLHSPMGVVGHSFGGRCALSYTHHLLSNQSSSQQHMEGGAVHPPQNTWLLDTVPGMAHPSVSKVVQAVSSIPTPILNKKDLARQLVQEKGIDPAIAAWMTTNLTPSKTTTNNNKGYDFTFDMNVVQSILNDFPNQNFMKMISDCVHPPNNNNNNNNTKMHIVIAGKNNDWTDDILNDIQDIKEEAPNPDMLQTHTLPNAGHWVHVDDINGLMKTIEAEYE